MNYIDLSYNSICDKGVKALAKSLAKNHTLTEIVLDNNNIGNNGAKAVAESLLTNNTLTSNRSWS